MSLQKDEGGVVRTAGRLATGSPQLPLEEWEATKDTLHLWAQIVGKTGLPLPRRAIRPTRPSGHRTAAGWSCRRRSMRCEVVPLG
jgi:hypothetical protein